jgi:hypothetical protein
MDTRPRPCTRRQAIGFIVTMSFYLSLFYMFQCFDYLTTVWDKFVDFLTPAPNCFLYIPGKGWIHCSKMQPGDEKRISGFMAGYID